MPDENKVIGIEQLSEYDALIKNYIATHGGSYVLPIASASQLGGIKVGNNLAIDQNGVLSSEIPIASYSNIGGFKMQEGYGAHIDQYSRLIVDDNKWFTFLSNDTLTDPVKVGSWGRDDLMLSVYKGYCYNVGAGRTTYDINRKIAKNVKNVVSFKGTICDAIIRDVIEIPNRKIFTYGGILGVNIEDIPLIGYNGANPLSSYYNFMIYHTKLDDEEITSLPFYSSSTSSSEVVKDGVRFSVVDGAIRVIGSPTSDVTITSSYSGATDSVLLPAIDISNYTIATAKLGAGTTSGFTDKIKVEAYSYDGTTETKLASSLSTSDLSTGDFIDGTSLPNGLKISHIKITVSKNNTYTVADALRPGIEYYNIL